ncbi:MAG: hypothetical protein EP343_28555 [Deltaproteobacteria bacterium]|nr:MAG: hypothetical protein EP343_28555 [Deltaproteobacteria bacterium]
MGRKNKSRRKKKSTNVGPSLADKLSGIKLENPSKEAAKGPGSVTPNVSRRQEPEGDIDFAEAMGVSSPAEQDESDWLSWASQEVDRLEPGGVSSAGTSYSDSSRIQGTAKPEHPDASDALRRERDALLAEQEQQQAQLETALKDTATLRQQKEALANAFQELQSNYATLEQAQSKSRASLQRLRLEQRAVLEASSVEEPNVICLREAMGKTKIPEGREAEALGLWAQAGGQALLPHLYVESSSASALIERHLVLCCHHEACQEACASSSGRGVLLVDDASLCEVCEGSDNRRAVQQMVRACRVHRIYKVVLVGGSPDAHAELKHLIPDNFDLRLVSGKLRRDKQQATDDLRYSDLVVIWGPTILPHKISELYTKQKDSFPGKLHVVHTRGVASMARDVALFLHSL